MTSKADRRRKRKAQSCKCQHGSVKERVHPGSSLCEACRKSGRTISKPILPSDGKRKREDSESVPDSEHSQTSPLISSTTISQARNSIAPDSSGKKRRVLKLSASKPLESSRNISRAVQSQSSAICRICTDRDERRAWKHKLGGDQVSWFQCEMKWCKLWYHSSCVFVLLDQDPQSMIFCPAPSRDRAIFVCPNCMDQPEKGYDKSIQPAIKAFIRTVDTETKKRKDFEQDSSADSPAHILAVLDDIDFDLPREERYSGFDRDLVNRLVRNLHQSILNYDLEIQSVIDHSNSISDSPHQTPLAKWQLVDGHSLIPFGQQWFDIEEAGGKHPPRHEPITAALRTMLGTPNDDPLRIPMNLKNISYSQVHTGLVSWFVFDVIDNRWDLYKLPSMKPMRAMMAAAATAGEARWPGKGRLFLQEVQLRTWYKSEFQQTLISNGERFKQSLEAFLRPLTMEFDRKYLWSDAGRRSIIEITSRLWSYLQSLQGKLVIIQPAIGDIFDPKLHEAYDREGVQLNLGKNAKKKILWILCRGFQYEESDGIESAPVFTTRARVIVH